MDNCIARQPIIGKDGKIAAYELLYFQNSQTVDSPHDFHTAQAIVQFFNQLDESSFLDGRDAFLSFTPNLLMQNIPRVFDPHKLVIQVEDSVLVHPVARMMLQRYKKQGYRLSLSGFQFNSRYMNILSLIDILKINFDGISQKKLDTYLSVAKEFNLKLAAYHIDTPEARALAESNHFDYLQGTSVADIAQSKAQKNPKHLQSNFFRLMAAATREEPDLEEIAELIGMDVTLTFSLLKMVNSAYFAIPNRVKDIKQALTILGLGQLRQWIYLLSFGGEGDFTDEIIKISFQRAVFCQALSQEIPDFPLAYSEAYMLGMFSILDRLLDVTLEEALKSLPVSDELKNGLVKKEGMCGSLYRLTIAYEQGEWPRVTRIAQELNLSMETISRKYLEAVDYVTSTWNSLMEPFDGAAQTGENENKE